MKTLFKNRKGGLSLVEVLVATAIIAVAVYGMITTIAAQQMADARLRDKQVLSRLHRQFVREFLKNQRNAWTNEDTRLLGPDTQGVVVPFYSLAMGYRGGEESIKMVASRASPGATIASEVWTVRASTPPITLASSRIVVPYPYGSDWEDVRP